MAADEALDLFRGQSIQLQALAAAAQGHHSNCQALARLAAEAVAALEALGAERLAGARPGSLQQLADLLDTAVLLMQPYR